MPSRKHERVDVEGTPASTVLQRSASGFRGRLQPSVIENRAAPSAKSNAHRSNTVSNQQNSRWCSGALGATTTSSLRSHGMVADNASRMPLAVGASRRPRAPCLTTSQPASITSSGEDTGVSQQPQAELTPIEKIWKAKTEQLEKERQMLEFVYGKRCIERTAVLDAIEEMVTQHESHVASIMSQMDEERATHERALKLLSERQHACHAKKEATLEEIMRLENSVQEIERSIESLQETVVVETDSLEQLEIDLEAARERTVAMEREVQSLGEEEVRMQDASYGLSGEVKQMVLEMESFRQSKSRAEQMAMEVEVKRRELYSYCEELRGTIRVYCRVKGVEEASQKTVSPARVPDDACDSTPKRFRREESNASCSTAASTVVSGHQRTLREGEAFLSGRSTGNRKNKTGCAATEAGRPLDSGTESSTRGSLDEAQCFSFPSSRPSGPISDASTGNAEVEAPVSRSICVHHTRSNATSSGRQACTETFTYDRVFDGTSSQSDVYREVAPLVNCAVDGYRVCIFAYGQTGSGKTYTMEGSLRNESGYGITPRAMETVFRRKEELAKEGWAYELTCYFVEIYNDTIRDLLQSPSLYENGGGVSGSSVSSNYHTVKHDAASGRVTITNVRERTVSSMEAFRNVYRQGIRNRSTAKTQLNDRSSRSHCVFTLRICGVNETIRQRSEGILCLVDLAGSERVNDSGVQGQQFKESVSINRSLLDLGKCIQALRTGAVVPWRNSRLTYLLQGYLEEKGSKLLMLVTVSDKHDHLPESLNSLRFALRVSQTVVGSSVKRVTSL